MQAHQEVYKAPPLGTDSRADLREFLALALLGSAAARPTKSSHQTFSDCAPVVCEALGMLAELQAEIARQGGYDDGSGPEPVVTLELFFDGNDDPGSIGCNLSDHPGPDRFYGVLSAIRDRPEVYNVWVGISEVMGPDEWPFSDHVYVVTTASPAEVGSWADALHPDDPGDDWWNGVPPLEQIEVPPDARLVTLWWD